VSLLIAAIAAFCFGTLIGSFLNVVIWRLPRSAGLGGRSQCPHCHAALGPANLVPLLSYAAQRGRCAQCGARISPRYPLIEAATGLLFAAAAVYVLAGGGSPASYLELARWLFIITVLITVFVIDLEHYLILDIVVFPAVGTILILNIVLDLAARQPLWSLGSHTVTGILAAALGAGFFYLLWLVSRGRWMGFGDVKLNLFLGLALGLPGMAVALFLAFMLGAVVGVGLIALRLKKLQSQVPFGTFLSTGALLVLFYGPSLWSWYARLVGWR
jgi:leader peptidase (prepilin peptidase) / N-methyltransferase